MSEASMRAAVQRESVHCIIMTRWTDKLIVRGAHTPSRKVLLRNWQSFIFYKYLINNIF
jgi:hypothetical protein